jgi:shikimate kinase
MVQTNRTRCVFLIGFMGAGKTSVGRMTAQRLRWKFCDLDRMVEHRAGKPISAIFSEQGEAGFRKLESAVLQDVLKEAEASGDSRIVALGGGAFVQPENEKAIANAGAITILLEAPLEELQRRCAQDNVDRPLARDAERFAELFQQRRGAYRKAQHHVNTMGKSVGQVAQEVERIVADAAELEVKQ